MADGCTCIALMFVTYGMRCVVVPTTIPIPTHRWTAQVARRSSFSARSLDDQLHPTCSALSVIISVVRAVGIDGPKWDGPNRHVTAKSTTL